MSYRRFKLAKQMGAGALARETKLVLKHTQDARNE